MRRVIRTHVAMFLALFAELLLAQCGLLSILMSAVAVASTTAVAAALTVRAVLVAAVRTGPLTPTRIRTAIRDRELRTAFLAQRDPDARGRRRPRAPGRLVLTAA
ncbi:hypothetical protein J7W19_11665 [Streptomyces mobaraensis NBRC 13819 = DSM 40847]|uniref:Uncharacterized protein n=2 Tax=Streptomyces mobaraensis TaxID=35621 RepID=A0A5N5WDQ4_STRMB|nr:DUF6412 domain-containing protein [Streptomyces mobaraensis]EME97330.1 hypothetical protein H340_27001 [Streptomyces mobaraensis NBRC 13819 = DSM 40847]KAB7849909.1 hypothetical protein FRZ00_04525 [Streptomyces mobaraensis]QTT73983.1 hypothetical protein J7W19_11665 [Streptomyces mobaraensis NBRC 13819 = DSM 40847]